MGCCSFIAVILIVFFATPIMTSSIQEKSIVVNEEEEPGTVIVRMTDLVQISGNSSVPPTFKILSQKFLVNKAASRRKQSPHAKPWLTIDRNTGEISCLRRLDREVDCLGSTLCEVELKAVVLPQIHFSVLNLKIVINDINDNAPTFRSDLPAVNITEQSAVGNVFSIDMYKARDDDLGVNSELSYTLSDNDYLDLKQSRGLAGDSHIDLILKRKLDYEIQKQFTLQLTAIDNGERKKISNVIDLVIAVTDENDNDPVFTEEEYEVTLKENLPSGYVIKTVRAVDLDSEDYGTVRYYLSDRNGKSDFTDFVKIDEISGEVSLLQHLDRETHNGLRIPIEARDGDLETQRIGHTWLVIRVIDINDNAPVITVNFIIDSEGNKAFLTESSPVGTFIAYVIVSDADDGRNGEVTTTISTQGLSASGDLYTAAEGTFKMVKDGLIQTNKDIDRELCSQYQLHISACDEGVSRNCTKKVITIDILDINEHSPVFESPKKHVTLREDSSVGTIVTSMQAYDGDSENMPSYKKNKEAEIVLSENGNVEYSITGNERLFFSIDPVTGKIVLDRPLDRESTSTWRINVIATDKGRPHPLQGSSLVEVEVTDVNDNAPVFSNPSVNNSLIYASTLDAKAIIAHVKAIDKDFGRNAMIRYSVVQSPERIRDLFVIDSISGEVSFSKDADVNNSKILHKEHKIVIQANDDGVPSLTAHTTLRIHVTNEPLKSDAVSQITNPKHAGMDFMMLAIGLGSASVFLIIVIVIIIVKCRRENEKVRTYRCRDAEAKPSSCVGCNCSDSSNDVRSETNTAPSSNPETNSTVANSCNNRTGPWVATNNRHDTDSVLSGSAGYSSNSSHLTKSDVSEPPNAVYQSSPNGRTPAITVLTAINNGVTSPIRKIGGRLHSLHDSDSGRGESETDVGSYDVASDTGCRFNKRCPLTGTLDDVFQKEMEEYHNNRCGTLGPRCTDQCLRYGHSDLCWMPSPEKKLGNRLECIRETQLPPINTARILPTKPRCYSERTQPTIYSSTEVFVPRTCSKATSIDQISQISSACSAPERSVSSDQYYIPSNDGKRNIYNKLTVCPAGNFTRHPSLTRDGNVEKTYKTSSFVNNKTKRTRSAEKMANKDQYYEQVTLLPKPQISSEETQNIIDNINKLLV